MKEVDEMPFVTALDPHGKEAYFYGSVAGEIHYILAEPDSEGLISVPSMEKLKVGDVIVYESTSEKYIFQLRSGVGSIYLYAEAGSSLPHKKEGKFFKVYCRLPTLNELSDYLMAKTI